MPVFQRLIDVNNLDVVMLQFMDEFLIHILVLQIAYKLFAVF